MKVKIYVNWEEREIVKEDELAEVKDTMASDILDNTYERKHKAYDFICEKDISAEELFCMDESERKKLMEEFINYITECVDETVKDEYEEIVIEI